MVIYQQSKEIDSNQLAALYNSVGWTAYTKDLEKLQHGIKQSLTVVTAWQD